MMAHTFVNPVDALAYFTECALATEEGLPANTSARERRRLKAIAAEMVRHCALFGWKPDFASRSSRLAAAIAGASA